MIVDPEEMLEHRRQAVAHQAEDRQAPAPADPSPQFIATQRMLAEQRAADRTFEARRVLCLIRSDRHPSDVETLTAAIDQVAADEGMSAAAVRDLLDTALQLEGSSFDAWKADLGRRRPRIGRGAKPAQQLLQADRSIMFLLTLVGLCFAEDLSAAAVPTSTAAVVALRCGPRTAVSWTASDAQLVAAQRVPSARPQVRTSFAARSGGHCLPRRTGRASGEHGGRRGAARSGAAARIPSGALRILRRDRPLLSAVAHPPRHGDRRATAGGFLPSRDARSLRARALHTTYA